MFVRNSFLLVSCILQALTLPYLAIARRTSHRFSSARTASGECGELCFPRAIEAYEEVIDAMLLRVQKQQRVRGIE